MIINDYFKNYIEHKINLIIGIISHMKEPTAKLEDELDKYKYLRHKLYLNQEIKKKYDNLKILSNFSFFPSL